MKRIILKQGEERRILAGHPWVYDNEIAAILDGGGKAAVLEPGECADVEARVRGRPLYLGRAIVNPRSRITARIYSASKEGLDKGFFKRRLREALERRIAAGYDLSTESARILFGEADFLPGLIIDRFVGCQNARRQDAGSCGAGSWLVIQFLAYGMDSRRDMILEALGEIFSGKPGTGAGNDTGAAGTDIVDTNVNNIFAAPSGIFERSAPVRELEGLPDKDGIISGAFPQEGIVIRENGLSFLADPAGGQKTGHFLDQRDNRKLAGKYAAGLAGGSGKGPLRILDCFCYTGAFGITAAGAVTKLIHTPAPDGNIPAADPPYILTAVDASAAALNLAQKNAALNGTAIQTLEADVFDFLKGAERRKERYDFIILDPPAFAKSRSSLESALRGYKEINLRALCLLNRGGILVSCSCSHAVDEGSFKRMIAAAASDAERRLVQFDFRYQPPDHPVLVGYDESLYLKCGFYRVL